MLGFKPIDEFTLDDCVKCMERLQREEWPVDAELKARYEQLLDSQENQEQTKCPDTPAPEPPQKAVNKNPANNQKPQNCKKPKKEETRRKPKKKSGKVALWIIGIICILGAVFFIGYKPVSRLSTSVSSIEFSKNSEQRAIGIRTDAPDCFITGVDYISPSGGSEFWLDASLVGDSVIIKVSRNENEFRTAEIRITAYPQFFGINIDFLKKTCRVTVDQMDGHATTVNVSSENISFPPEGNTENVQVSTDGFEWDITVPAEDWLSVSKIDESSISITAEENSQDSSRLATITVYSDNIQKDISVSQSAYEKKAEITEITWPGFGGNEDAQIKVGYTVQGYSGEDLYVVMKIYSNSTNYVWYKNYTGIYASQAPFESSRIFKVAPSSRRGHLGSNTIYVCLSRYPDGGDPICYTERQLTLVTSR